MSDPTVLTSLDDEGVLTVTMNRPSRRNAFNSEAFLALGRAFDEANGDPRVAVVLLTGAGDDFSSGLDLSALDMSQDGEPPFERMMDSICALTRSMAARVRELGCAAIVCDISPLGIAGANYGDLRNSRMEIDYIL